MDFDMNTAFLKESSAIDSLYLALVQCFGIIVCGYVAGRLEVITKVEANGLNTFVGTFSLPALIFLSMAKLDFSTVNWLFLLAVFIAKSVTFFIVLIISIISIKPSNFGRSALFAIFTTQSNDFAIGYPMIKALYGSTHSEYSDYLYLMAPISLVVLNPIGFVFLEIAKKNQSQENRPGGTNLDMLKAIAKGIALNPVVLMTVLGIIGNLIFTHNLPDMIEVILEVFGSAFSASALFLLGFMMVGKIHKLKGAALVIPGILISVKLLVLPLIIRESVVILHAGQNTSDTSDLSTFGFLYGTIPTAPALFIFTLRYNVDIDLIASAMVVCTFLSAPLMFLSAKLISASGISPSDYAKQLKAFSLDTSAASVAACIWLLICFLAIKRNCLKSPTHRCTFCIILAQLLTGVGVIIWTKLDLNSVGTLHWYIQFTLIAVGIYACRFWTAAISVTLLFLSSQTIEFVEKIQKLLFFICWGIPCIIIGILCLTVTPTTQTDSNLRNPNFQFGKVHAALSVLVLLFCFFVTIGCLILRQRYQRRSNSQSYSNLVAAEEREINNSDRLIRGQNIIDVEDLVSPTGDSRLLNNFNNDCVTELCNPSNDQNCNRDCDLENETGIDIEIDTETLRHLVLLILLSCSMFIGLAMSVATLIMEQISGVYAELAFLDVALGFGQSLIAFTIFGLDPGLGRVGCWLRNILRKYKREKELQLPDEDTLSQEVKAFREQFKRCYLVKCQARIGVCRRNFFRTHNSVFTGTDFVNWLLEAGIAKNRDEAVHYGRSLIDSRVLNHIDGNHHFHDRNFLYSFTS